MRLSHAVVVIWALLHRLTPSRGACAVTARVQALVQVSSLLENASTAVGSTVDLLAATQLGINASLLPSGVCIELLAVPVDLQQAGSVILTSKMVNDPLTVAIVAIAPSTIVEKAGFALDGAR